MTASQSIRIYKLLNEHPSQPEEALRLAVAVEAILDEKAVTGQIQSRPVFTKQRAKTSEQKLSRLKWFVAIFYLCILLLLLGLLLKE